MRLLLVNRSFVLSVLSARSLFHNDVIRDLQRMLECGSSELEMQPPYWVTFEPQHDSVQAIRHVHPEHLGCCRIDHMNGTYSRVQCEYTVFGKFGSF